MSGLATELLDDNGVVGDLSEPIQDLEETLFGNHAPRSFQSTEVEVEPLEVEEELDKKKIERVETEIAKAKSQPRRARPRMKRKKSLKMTDFFVKE